MSKIKIEVSRVRAIAKKTLLEKNLTKATIDNVVKLFVSNKKNQTSSENNSEKTESKTSC